MLPGGDPGIAGSARKGSGNLPPPAQVRITRIGADGDGVAALPDGAPLYIPFTLPGEHVTARPVAHRGEGWLAEPVAIDTASAARVTPPCAHFGACGGCTLQHWRQAEYLDWKRGLLDAALRRAGFADPAIAPVVVSEPRTRRRMDLAVRRAPDGVHVGLHRPRSPTIIDLRECHVLHPALFALIAPLRAMLGRLAAFRREASAVVNLLESGPDLLLRTDAPLSLADRTALTGFARAHGLPRIAWARGTDAAEPVCVLRPATTVLSGVTIAPPPGAFLQATEAGERTILDTVLAALPDRLPKRARIAELYAGCGTITFALAQQARVAAWEGDAAAIAALRAAANQSGLAGRIEATQRDLARQPLLPGELAGASAVVLDPPYAGAGPQMARIAEARAPLVVYVSCNPAALSRDARLLHGAGYQLAAATPIDQFPWSARLESVCVFRR